LTDQRRQLRTKSEAPEESEDPGGFREQRGYQSSAERVSEPLYGMAQLWVGMAGWKWQRKKELRSRAVMKKLLGEEI